MITARWRSRAIARRVSTDAETCARVSKMKVEMEETEEKEEKVEKEENVKKEEKVTVKHDVNELMEQ